MPKEKECINADGHRYATVKRNEDGSYELYCKECGVAVEKADEAH